MNDFKTAAPPATKLDPKKRVNYALGMVLGVDEFRQEQTYFIGKQRLHHRALHGYGTVSGLQVSRENGGNGPEILVKPGRAVDLRGQDICVTPAQCSRLNDWLRSNQETHGHGTAEAFDLTLYLTLCYRECETDLTPIPGAPCRSQQDSMAASRIADDFELKFTLQAPLQIEEDAIRQFGALLARLALSEEAPSYLSREELLDLVRELGSDLGSPPTSPPASSPPSSPPVGSPPFSDDILYLNPATACEDLRAALRIWVTEVRPALLSEANCNGHGMSENCVLLAQIDFHVAPGLSVDFDSIVINEDDRPYLLQTRLLQEWLLCGRLGQIHHRGDNQFATAFALDSETIRVWIHHPGLLAIPLAAVTVAVEDTPIAVQGIVQPLPDANVFDLQLSVSPPPALFHQQRFALHFDVGLITESSPPTSLSEVISQAGFDYLTRNEHIISVYGVVCLPRLDDLVDVEVAEATNGQVPTFQNGVWVAAAPGDVGALALDDLTDVKAPSPKEGNVLVFQDGAWRAASPSAGVTDHGALTGLGDDDHPQYHNDARGDARYALLNHTHALDDLSDVNAPTPANGEVLTWNQGANQWEPRPGGGGGEFVLAPAGPYAIVAAGYFQADGTSNGPVYNDLTASPLANPVGDYVLNFKGYTLPDNFMYIVKGTVEDLFRTDRPRMTFQFIRFQQNGIRVRILGINNEPQKDLGFMVEISLFGKF